MTPFPDCNKEHNAAHIKDKFHFLLPAPYAHLHLLTVRSSRLTPLSSPLPVLRKTARRARRILARKMTALICVLVIFCSATNGFCLEDGLSSNTVPLPATADVQTEADDKTLWQKIWGKKVRDSVLMGMWSIHLKGSGEYFGSGESNEQNKLIAMVYNGIGAGTFINSHGDRSWFIGLGREVYSRDLAENTRFDIGYRLGPMYGYDDTLPNICDISVFAAGTLGFSWYKFGFDVIVIPIGVIAGGFRIDF